jgi:radical SAM-linked protein
LPWDHLDTGIDKNWLKADWQRALAAATVPDCSFEGCSHCGICGTDFGHNIAIEPPPIPQFTGHFQPNQQRATRFRVWFGKQGDMALVSHLDLARLFDRAIRRAGIPISYTGGFHPTPRISFANALSLGATSEAEIVDFELTQPMDEDTFRAKLAAQLPENIPIYRTQEIDLKAPAMARLLAKAEYWIKLEVLGDATPDQWQNWIDAIKTSETINMEATTKSGQTRVVNLRDRLFELDRVEADCQANSVTLRYIGSCRNDGTLLRPDHVIFMLEQVVAREFHLVGTHRRCLILEDSDPLNL